MKTIYSVLFSMFLLLTGHTLSAQLPQIIGTTQAGGANNAGTIYKSNFDGSAFTPVYSFDYQSGTAPAGKLVQAANKLLYGANIVGGHKGAGCLFSYDPVNNIYKDVFNFNGTNGRKPSGGLLLANNGLLYGTTFDGGSATTPGGTLFSFNPTTNICTLLLEFPYKGTTGFFPRCTLIQGTDGKLYGTTSIGGIDDEGVIFSFDISNNTYSKLYDFTTAFRSPYGALVQASNGEFYGLLDHRLVMQFMFLTRQQKRHQTYTTSDFHSTEARVIRLL